MAPPSNTPAATVNAQKKCPVRPTTNPVSAGAMPAKLPTKFCTPVHLPAASGPASVCVMAQRLEVHSPAAAQVKKRKSVARSELNANATMAKQKTEPSAKPRAVNVLRTRVGVPPRAIQKSEIQPEIKAETARMRYAAPPIFPIFCIEKCRS